MAKTKSLSERLREKQEDLKRKGGGFQFLSIKEGTTRMRILPVGEEADWAFEAVYFYLGVKDHMAVISPATFGGKCAIMNQYNEMSASKNASDREFAKKFKPGKRYFVPVIKYKDEKGKEVDEETGVKLLIITAGLYNELIDLFLDEENGDFTSATEGYDIKFKRTGKGKMDTEYSVLTCKPSALPKKYKKDIDLEALVKEVIPSYKDTKTIMESFLNLPPEEEAEAPLKIKKKKKSRDL